MFFLTIFSIRLLWLWLEGCLSLAESPTNHPLLTASGYGEISIVRFAYPQGGGSNHLGREGRRGVLALLSHPRA